jgi:hypothetical protein
MAINNTINTPFPVPVTKGGTGLTTGTTAYAPLCAGTTATGNFQVASTGLATAGSVLTSTGSSSIPTWQPAGAVSGGMILLSTVNISTQSTINLYNLFSSTYSCYLISLIGLTITNNGQIMWLRYGTGATPTIKSGASDYSWTQVLATTNGNSSLEANVLNADSKMVLTKVVQGVSSDAAASISGNIYLYNPAIGSLYTSMISSLFYMVPSTGLAVTSNGNGKSTNYFGKSLYYKSR